MTSSETENEMLEDSALEEVAGGAMNLGGCHFYGSVSKDSGVVGRNYYVVVPGSRTWHYGTLLKSYDQDIIFGLGKHRNHEFHIFIRDGREVDTHLTVSEDKAAIYTNMTKA